MNKFFIQVATFTLLSISATRADAHVVLEQKTAVSASAYTAVFKVGHGCSGSPTTEIIVYLPEGISTADAVTQSGWQLDQSVPMQIRWHGGLLGSKDRAQFVLNVQLPKQIGLMYWRVKQVCVSGETDWSEAPSKTEPDRKLKTPAAILELTEK